ncbi:MAG TPA: hypothetical protein H9671_12340 [Firmicutes bacterium]|nr:hypothetical protein [Bacillota bacterium]
MNLFRFSSALLTFKPTNPVRIDSEVEHGTGADNGLPAAGMEEPLRQEKSGMSFNSSVLMILNEAKSYQEKLNHAVPRIP